MLAKFADGSVHEVSEVLVCDFRQRAKGKTEEVARCDQESVAKKKFIVKLKKDRVPLMTICNGGRQICQVPVNKFLDENSAAKFMEAPLIKKE